MSGYMNLYVFIRSGMCRYDEDYLINYFFNLY